MTEKGEIENFSGSREMMMKNMKSTQIESYRSEIVYLALNEHGKVEDMEEAPLFC